jgi:hypothetical protein
MPAVNQEINVNINALVKKIGDVREFVSLIKGLPSKAPLILDDKFSGNAKAAAGDVGQLANSIDGLGKKIESLKPSKFQEISTLLQGLAAGSTIFKNLGGTFEAVGKGIAALRTQGTALVEGVAARAGSVIETVTSKASRLAAELPLIGEGGAAAAIGIGGIAAAGAGAVVTIGALVAAVVAIGAAITALHAAALAFIPALVSLAFNVAQTDNATGKLEDRIRGGEIVGLLAEFKNRASDLSNELGRALVPAILQLLRVALDLVNQLGPVVRPFFDFVLHQIDRISDGLVKLVERAIAAGKGIAAAIAIGLATGSPDLALKAALDTFNKSLADLEKAANTRVLFAGLTGDLGRMENDKDDKQKKERPPRPEDTSQSELELAKAKAQAEFDALRDSLDREHQMLTRKYNDRKLTISQYYEEILRNEDAALEAQQIRLQKELAANDKQLHDAIQKLEQDRKSGAIQTDEELAAKETNENNRAKARQVELESQLNKILDDRARLPIDIALKEKDDTDALNAALQEQIDAIDRLRGIGPLVEVRQQIGEIDKLIEKFADNPGMVAFLEEWREVLGLAGQTAAIITRLQTSQLDNEGKIRALEEQGNQNALARYRADQQIVAIKKEELKAYEDALAEAVALGAKDADSLAKIEDLRAAIARLKIETRSFHQILKDAVVDNLSSGLENFLVTIGKGIKSFQDLKKAALDFLQSFIDGLLQVLAHKLALDLINGILGGGGTSSSPGSGGPSTGASNPGGILSSIGGFFSKLFGHAAGDIVSSRPGGRVIQVAEGGYDELVATTDPKYSSRTSALLGAFIRRTGILPSFAAGGFARSLAGSFSIPRLAAGALVAASPIPALAGGEAGGATFNAKFVHVYDPRHVHDAMKQEGGEEVFLHFIDHNAEIIRRRLRIR